MNNRFETQMKQFNNTAQEIPFEPITEQIRRQAQRIPEETAVVSGEESITFAELDRISHRIAAGLRLLGIQAGAETMVGVILNRTWRVYAAELGILKAGGAYIPFAAEYPDARIHYCMEDAGSPLLITSEKLKAERPGLLGKDYRIVTIEELMTADGAAFEPASIGPDSLALAVYTSGSTGNPKGVLIEHISLVESAFPCETNPLTALFSAGQVFMPVTSMGFVAASYFDLSALCAGKTVCVPDEEERMDAEALIRCIRRNNVSEAFFSPSLIKSLWYSPAREVIFALVESIGTGSEKIELSLVREMMAQYPKLKIFNFYGASETCVGCTCGVLCPEDEVITVGSPVTNVTVAVLSEDGKTLPPGEKGELIVCGDRLFRGYMNLPEKNKEVFFEYEGKRAFRTGDVACWTKDGRIRIFGRDDDMVKVRGHRVELPEVEDAIKSYPGIKNNKALLRSGESEEFLVAFFAAKEKISIPKLRQYLSLRLPSYMIPSLFMQLDQLPLNDNGKTDRIALQNMELRAEEQDLTPPETETEKTLFSMLKSITGIHGFGTRTSILSLGITSLSAMRLSARIRETFGVFIRYSDILQEPTIEGIARMIREASEKESGAPSPAEVHEEAVALSENQKGVYLAWELDRESTAYNLPFVYRFEAGEVSPKKLEKAVKSVIEIHSGMNLRLQIRKGEVFQAAGAAAPEPIPVIAALHTPDQAYYRSRIRPFDLFEGPLYRFEIHVSKEYTDLFMDIHHIIFDGISSTIFERDLNAALRGETPKPEICSASRWYAAQKGASEEVSGYFEALVSQAECASYPASLQPDGCGLGTVKKRIPAAAVQQFCREHEITPSSFFHGAFAEALRRITANDNPFYLTVSSGRGDSWELSNTTGFFVKTLPVALPSSEGSQTVVSYAREVHDRMQEILRRDSCTYTTLAETQQLRGEILFAYQGEIRQPDAFVSGRAAALAPKDPQFPVFVEVYPEGEEFVYVLSYDGNLYSRRDMECFAGACAASALSMAECDWIRQVRLVSQEEEAELKALSRGKELPYDRTMTWVDHFLLHAEAHPDRTAVTDRFGSFTCGQLLAWGWRVAAYLERRGVSEGDFVAVKMGRVKEFPAAVLGIHLAGAAYVPIDPEYPEERIRYILEDCEAKVLLTEEELQEISDNDPVCCQAAAKAAPEQVAYMIYTSGSTGRPKGVMIQHRAMMNFLQFTADCFHITEESRLACHCNFSFDVSVESLFGSLMAGGMVFIVSEETRKDPALMRAFIREHGINGGSYPTQFGQLLGADEPLDVDYFCIAGEKMNTVPKVRGALFNGYGPTEFTVYSTVYQLDKEKTYRDIPIGRPAANCSAYVTDAYGNLMPRGMTGELCLAGPQLALGYWKQEELTEEKFRPLGEDSTEMVYHTGDLVRWDEEGNLIYAGRMDFQVKLRGYRIELGEIESAALRCPGITEALALVKNEQLCLYFTCSTSAAGDFLRPFLEKELASYMVPSVLMQLPSMPVNANGKIDRAKLPEPQAAFGTLEMVPAANQTEQHLFDLAAQVLGTEHFGVTDNLVSLGLSSLDAMKLSAAAEKQLGAALRVAVIMKHPFIRSLAQELSSAVTAPEGMLQLKPYPLQEFYPLTENQMGVYLDWELHRNTTQYNIPFVFRFDEEPEVLCRAVKQAAAARSCLRAELVSAEEGVVQRFRRDGEIQVEMVTLDHQPDAAWFQEQVRPFDLLNEPLYRLMIADTPAGTFLFMDIHHIIFDGLSADLFLEDIRRGCLGILPEEETVSFFDYALYEKELTESRAFAAAKQYFDGLLQGVEHHSIVFSGETQQVPVCSVQAEVSRRDIRAFCSRSEITEGSFWHAVFGEVMFRLTREPELLYVTASSGRAGILGLENTAGMFVRTVPVVLHRGSGDHGSIKTADYAAEVHAQLQESYAMDLYPYTRMVDRHKVRSEIMFLYQGGLSASARASHAAGRDLTSDTAKFPLEVTVYSSEDRYTVAISCDGYRFSEGDIRLLAEAMVHGAQHMVRADTLGEVCVLSHDQQQRMMEQSTGAAMEYDTEKTWVDYFRRQAEAMPQRPAVTDSRGTLTYRQLDQQSDCVAAWLLSQGLEPEQFVAVKMDRRKEFAVAALGIHKAGGAYVAIDLTYPKERIRYLLQDSEAAFVLDEALVHQIVSKNPQAERVNRARPDGLAYMAYTSGSTGNPKGIMIPHRAMLNFVRFIVQEFQITEESRLTCHCSFSSDVSLESIFTSLICGANVFLVPEEVRRDVLKMRRYIRENRITGGSYFTQFGQLLGADETLNLDYIALIGEKMTAVPNITGRVYNTYGPTEFIEATYYLLDSQKEYDDIPVGRPMHNCTAVILDSCGQLLPAGIAGEICLAGPQMARGYWKLPEKTAEVFTVMEHGPLKGMRVYRTGDLGRWNREGELEFLGRIDFQVKLRGYRIEPGEVEARAAKFPGILQEVAVVRKDRLCLYYTADRGIDEAKLRRFLGETLAAYMVPSEFLCLEEMPLTPNGKIRREALPDPVISEQAVILPATETEEALFAIAAGLLQTDAFGVESNLISLGMSSLGAMKLSVAVRQELGRELSVADIMRQPEIRALAVILQQDAAAEEGKLCHYPEQAEYPLAENQRGVYLECMREPASTRYNLPVVCRFDGKDPQKLKAAVLKAAAAHTSLSLRMREVRGEVVQYVQRDEELPVPVSFLDHEPETEDYRSRIRPFDLAAGPLVRAEILVSPKTVYLFLDFHHLVFDGISADIFLVDILKAYDGEEIRPELITAADAALYEKSLTGTEGYREAEEYFDGLLSGAAALSYPASAAADGEGPKRVIRKMSRAKADAFLLAQGITASSFWHSAFAEALYRLTREESFLYLTVSSGRSGSSGLDRTTGMFARTIPVVYRKNVPDASVNSYLHAVHDQLQETISRDFYPYTALSERFGLRGEVMFLYQGALMEGGNLQERVTLDLSGDQVKFPLDIIVYPEGDSYTLCLEYDGALYSREDMELLAGAVVHMAENLTDAETVKEVSVLGPGEEQAVKELSKGEALEYDRTKTWVDLFLEQAAARPQKTAVSDGSTSLTYRELDALSNRFAAYLLAQGIAPDDFVAVRMDRVKEISVVLLGIHKAGAAYVPFDLDCPQERADFMLSDSGAKLLVTEAVVREALAVVPSAAPVRNMTPENIAYMIYTSGSTGTPKGVMIQHKALMNFTQFICVHFGLTAESHISCHVNFAFDASVEDLFPVYTVGGTLYIVPEEIRRDVYLMRQFIVKHRINGGNYSTQFGQLLAADEPLTLDYINLGGEKMTAVPKISGRVFNTYGPTEFTDDSTYFEIDKTKTYRNIPIGRPLYNCTAYVADPCGQLLPRGACGELCMAGPQMAKGYWNRPELTAEKFRVLGTSVPEMVYHTGDLVRWNSEDQLEYLGRMDFQVKLRGYRIELGEIESAAMNYPPVKIAAAEVRKEQICLYFEASEDVDVQALCDFMERTLSDYMVPSAFVQLPSMPLNQNGKIDRRKLPDPVLASAQCTAPATPLEVQLFDCAAEILGHRAFGVTDDLIAVGMSSLGAMRFSAALAREHNLAVRVADIMRTPVIRVLAEALKQGGEAAPVLQVPVYPPQSLYPLTHNQLGVYLDWEMSPGTTEYNNPFVYGFADVSEGQLKDAVRRVMETHPYLMTTLVMEGSILMQKPGNPEDLQIAVSCLQEEPEPDWFQQKVRPFDLHAEPLYRLEIVGAPSGVYLFADFHHILYDGLSGDLFLQDLIRALAGENPEEEGASAFDYALYEQELLAGAAFAKAEAYFHDLAAGAAAVSWPVSDIPDGTAVGVVRKTVRRAEIEEFCRKERITASSCWHAAFAEALQRLTRAEAPLYTTVSNGRLGDPGLEHTAGMFAKTLPVVLRETGEKHGDETVSSFVRSMHRQLLDSFAQDYYPFAQLVEKFGIRPEIMFNYRSDMLEAGEQGAVVIHALMPDKVKFPLELTVYPQGQDFVLIIEYDGHMYGAADMELFAGAIVCAAQNLTRAERVRDVALVSEEEQQRILMHSKGMEFSYDATETWLDLFFRQTDAAPDRMAVADDHSAMTYGELDRQSDRFAAWLIQQGVKPDDFVVVRMGRVKEFMVAVLGIHKAGAAYVPIDLEYPPERVAYMQENADAEIIVSEELIEQALLQVPAHPGRICLATPDNTAYMIYTSGSTGKPKGVMIPHRGLLNFVHCIRHSYEITEESRITLMKNFAFDASIEDMYPVLTKGGVLFIINEEIRHDVGLMLEFVKTNHINGGGYPTQFGQLMAAEESLKVQYLTAGGEAMTLMPKAEGNIINVYGPTEFTDDATFFWVDKDADYRNIPIGRPLYNNTALIVDQHNQLLPQGAMGELCLSGPQMAKGYWKLPELTAQKFCTLSEQVPLKVYHTGDLARWNDQWQLEYMGRFDFQVKLRGYRIELGEIEVRAGQFEGVKQEVAVVKNEELCLYFTADRAIDTRALKEFMAETLAEFMVPSRFIQLDAMPLTPNGKINRSQLPEPEFETRDLVEPETELEKALFDIASGILHRTGFGVTDSLIAAGLSSLGAMRFSVEVHHQLGRALRVSEIMHNPQIRSLAALLEEGADSGSAADIPSYPPQLYYPLTENQKGIYLDWEMNKDTVQYNLPSVYRFTGISAETLEEAVRAVINTHPSMKTRLAHWNGAVVQENRSSDPAVTAVLRTEQEPDSAYFQSRVLPFDLFAQPLYRMEITESPQAVYLFMDCHHIIFDGLSRDIFLEDLEDALEGILPEEEQLCAFDFALYEQELLEGGAFVRAEAYFDDLMKDSAVAVYPSSRRLHTAEKGENGVVYAELSEEEGERIRAFCSSQGITESSFWHSAFAEALHRITREEKPYYVTVSSGRAGTAGLARTTGMFAKTLPVVLSCSGKDHAKTPVSAYTAAMHQQLQDTIDRDLYPYTRLVERHQLRAEIMFVYQGGVMEGGNSEALTEIPFMTDQMKFPLEIMVYPTREGYTAACGYDGTRYEATDIQMLANALCTCARAMLTAEAAGDICLADEAETLRLAALGAGDAMEYNQEETWLDLFRARAMAMPEHCAVADEEGFLTYGELARQSDCIARGLIQRGVAPGSFVVLLTERRKEFLAAVIGIQKAGAAYVPVDPEYPQERKAYMVQDSCAALVLTDELIFRMLAEGTGAEEDPHLDRPEGKAYMIYTSGSTGKPKGVVQSHRALRAFVQWRRQLLNIGPDSRHAEHASFAFDASLDDLICPLAWGGEVHILSHKLRKDPDAMKQYFMENRITGLTLPTQLGMAMLAQDPDLPLKFLMMGGEKLLPLKQHTDVRIINGYGPTEFTVCASYFEVDQEKTGDIPIGRPVPGARVYICDGAGQLLPEGMTGELCLAGPQIAEGYWGQPLLTEEKFTVLAGTAPHRVYRTGDLARFNRDGNLEFCGRIDNQVKLRGYRIETEEIEHCALALAGVKQAAAAIRQDRICLYYTAEPELPEDALRRSLARQLAGYMMPELYLRLEEMPLTSNGKVDYRQLPAIAQANPPSSVPPKNEREEIVCRCMGSILGMDRMPGADQDFFAFGGDSIKAIRFVTLLRGSGVMVTVSDIMKGRTPAAIALLSRAEGLQPAASQEPWTGMVPETPILQYFRELKLPVPAHFNLPVILRCRKRTDPAVLQSTLDALTLQHDLLRAVIRDDVLFVREPDVRIVLEEYSTEDVTGICEKIQKELAVSEALLRAALIHTEEEDLLFLCAHHCIVDGVSWRIILSDLELAFGQAQEGEAVRLPYKTHSYREYAEALRSFCSSTALQRQLSFWQNMQKKVLSLPTSDCKDSARNFREMEFSMSEEETGRLTAAKANKAGADLRDLICTAAAESFCFMKGQSAVSVELEGHGRDDTGAGIDLDRTVGWFTSVYPIVFSGIRGIGLQDLIRVKESIRSVPANGIGYQVLRWMDGEETELLRTRRGPQMTLNYLGEMEETSDTEAYFRSTAGISAGSSIAPENVFGTDLTVNCVIQEGRFLLSLRYAREAYTAQEMENFGSDLIEGLNALVNTLAECRQPVITASDLGETEWSPEEFETVSADFASRGETLQRIYPLLPLQEAMLLKHISEPQSHAYRIVDIYQLNVLPTKAQLRRAIDRLARRHEVLRTAIVYEGVQTSRQAITDRMPGLTMLDLTKDPDPAGRVMQLRQELLDTAFDLQRKPLLQFTCAALSDSSCYLLLAVHHIIVDGWCTDVYMNDFKQFLQEAMNQDEDAAARSRAVPETAGSYEAAVREMADRDRKQSLNYWKNLLAGFEERTAVPFFEHEIRHEDSTADTALLVLDPALTGDLQDLCRSARATMANGVEMLWGLVLQSCSRTDDAVFAKVVSGRDKVQHTDVSRLVGFMINSVPVRVRTGAGTTARQLLRTLQQQTADSSRYDDCGLAEIQNAAAFRGPLVSSVLAFENYDSGRSSEEASGMYGFEMKEVLCKEEFFGELDLTAWMDEAGQLCVRMNYDPSKYSAVEIRRVQQLFRTLAEGVTRCPDQPLKTLPLLDDEEKEEILRLSKGPDITWDLNGTWLDLFAASVRDFADRPAVSDTEETITYKELDKRSDAVAGWMLQQGAGAGDFVAVNMDRKTAFITAIVAIHKIGAAYVPVDPEYPAQRVQYMLTDSQAVLVVTEASVTEALEAAKAQKTTIPKIRPQAESSGLAYMIYTSGSTGTPKGVMLHHAGLLNFTEATRRQNRLTPQDRIGLHFSFSFDSHIEDVFPVLASGACICIMPEEIRKDPDRIYQFLEQEHITGGGFTTSMGRLMIANYPLKQRYVTCIGEPLTGVVSGSTQIINRYGPTECTNVAALYPLEKGRVYHNIPVGRPMPGGFCFILDPQNRLLPQGAVGELCYAGIQVGRGYWKQGQKTAEVFEACPFAEGVTMYHTGDLARYNEEGLLECLGRMDGQVKLRGYRIEPGEIESTAMQHEGIRQAAAAVSSEQLCLYYTMKQGAEPAAPQALKEWLGKRLAPHMVPSVLIPLDAMPLTPNGKIDRKALPQPRQTAGAENLPPATPAEAKYLQIAKEFLPGADFGPTDDLIRLGMNSLTVMKFVMQIRTFNKRIRVSDVMRHRTIRAILAGDGEICWFHQPFDPKKPVLAAIQGIMPLNGMLPKYDEWSGEYNIFVFEPFDEHYHRLFAGCSYDQVMDTYANLLESHLPQGAVLAGLAGSSWGGELCYQIARRWEEKHETQPFVLMLDTWISDPKDPAAAASSGAPDALDASDFVSEEFLERFRENVTAEEFRYKHRLIARLEQTPRTVVPYRGPVYYMNAMKGYTEEEQQKKLAGIRKLFTQLWIRDFRDSDHYDLFLDQALNPVYRKLLSGLQSGRSQNE